VATPAHRCPRQRPLSGTNRDLHDGSCLRPSPPAWQNRQDRADKPIGSLWCPRGCLRSLSSIWSLTADVLCVEVANAALFLASGLWSTREPDTVLITRRRRFKLCEWPGLRCRWGSHCFRTCNSWEVCIAMGRVILTPVVCRVRVYGFNQSCVR
jgi:hypothetical protein